MKISRKKKTIVFTAAIVLVVLFVWTLWGNTALELNTYTVRCEDLPDAFAGYRIAHISDLHNTEIGEDNEKLIAMLREAEPDIIAVTGDLIDSRKTDIDAAVRFAAQAVGIAPVYYVTGNHEARVSEYADLREKLRELGVTVLEDERVTLEKEGESVVLIGANDPSFRTDYLFGDSAAVMEDKLRLLTQEEDGCRILLSHRPELFDVYAANGTDLVLAGHAHGGQIRLPFTGGLIAPNQGLFPEYDSGLYTDGKTNMVVSRGIGNSLFPLRFNNRPEVLLVLLTSA